jgi:hypothetical protein
LTGRQLCAAALGELRLYEHLDTAVLLLVVIRIVAVDREDLSESVGSYVEIRGIE